jgi:hypothetical protein
MNRPKLSAFPILAAATVAVVIYSPRDLALNVVIAVALIGLYIIFAPAGHDCDPPHSALGWTVAVDTLRNMQSGIVPTSTIGSGRRRSMAGWRENRESANCPLRARLGARVAQTITYGTSLRARQRPAALLQPS